MKFKTIIVILILFVGNNLNAQLNSFSKLSIDNLMILGKSNINCFKFELEKDSSLDQSSGQIITKKNLTCTEFLIPVTRFKTINKSIQNDFASMLKADTYPYIILSIYNNQLDTLKKDESYNYLNVILNIAGESNQYKIPISVKIGKKSNKEISGETQLLLSDFKLSPVSKFFGIIKVENQVKIDFTINFISRFT